VPRRGPKSDFGDYCPVTFCKSGFLVKGKVDFESFVFGKSYRFAGEKEQEEFKFNPDAYLSKVTIPLPAPEPKIMLVGVKGAGVTTQIDKLCKKFKISSLDMKVEFLKLMNEEKNKRKRARLLARGFKEPEPRDDDAEDQEPVVDEEIENDPAEFLDTIGKHYEELFQTIMPAAKPIVMDGHWTTMPEDLELNLPDTLVEARRTPEVVIILRCKEASTFTRRIDDADIKMKYVADCKKREEEMKAACEKDRAEKLTEVEGENKNAEGMAEDDPEFKPVEELQAAIDEAMKAWDEERKDADAQALEDDPVPDEKTRREEIEEKMREQIEKDNGYLDELSEKLKENGVEVIDNIMTDISADYVHIKILDKLKSRMQLRKDLIEREQAGALPTKDVKFYEESFTFKHSKFGLSSPLSAFNPNKTK
jgi:adenylate/nucleoside-diphosphate kinase